MATCYRHPSRETNVSCSNCGRPICPDCMTSTSVGMRCPECASQRTRVKNPVGAPTRSDAPATYVLIALCVLAFLAELASGGTDALSGGGKLIRDYGLFGPAVADGEQYRIVTSAFLHAGLLHLGLNMFVLYILGTLLEPAIGTARFIAIYAASILGGSFVALLLDPNELTVGASGGIFGLMAAAFLIARHRGLDQLASQLGFFVVINLVFTFSISNISVGAHLGGLAGGALAGLVITMVERRRPPNAQLIEIGGMVAICVVAVVGALLAADASTPERQLAAGSASAAILISTPSADVRHITTNSSTLRTGRLPLSARRG
jgi:membrane associated rhomboid family serine protease